MPSLKDCFAMGKKKCSPRRRKPKVDLSKDLWISPHWNLRGHNGDRAWDRRGNLSPGAGARFLELADVALGNKQRAPGKDKIEKPDAHEITKKNPPFR
jgi:hypothetical protein